LASRTSISHSQLEPDGNWRVWYLRGGRGAGKTRTGAETLAKWIRDWCFSEEDGDWAVMAPTFADARDTCMEGPSGMLKALKGLVGRDSWNRSHGALFLPNGSRVYCDGANDGGYRIQGKNLRGVWADEVGLWEKPEKAWHETLQPAVRFDPALIVATGTPKMAHPLIAHLIASPSCVVHHMRTVDNEDNLHAAALASLQESYGGTTLGRQELEGEFIEALEGGFLSRHNWRFFDCRDHPVPEKVAHSLPRFEQIVHSWDTAVKAKASNDPVAGQVWGCVGADRYLLRVFRDRASLDGTITHMSELLAWARALWPRTPHKVLIETSANGADAIAAMRQRVDGVYAYNPRDGGDKIRRALAASPALETGHCYLPGFKDNDPNGLGYTPATPGPVTEFVEELARFGGDGNVHDDQVDAWSQMVNWTRDRGKSHARLGRPSGAVPRPGSLAGVGR
jgi:phage terminase large subunit-like protein